MSTELKNASAFHKKLESQLQNYSTQTGESIERLRRKVAFDRFLARISTQDPPPFFLKGGYGMELRISQARATKDMDLGCLKRPSTTKDPITEIILQELQAIARFDLEDHFTYQIGQPQNDIENAPYGGSRHSVLTNVNNQLFVKFHLDVAADFLIDDIEKVPGINWLGFYGIDAPLIPMISIQQQFSEKLHSYTLPRDYTNTRVKDLIDLALLLKYNNYTAETFQRTLYRIFRARNTHPLPIILPEPPTSWEPPFNTMALECGLSQNLQNTFAEVSKFYAELQTIAKSFS